MFIAITFITMEITGNNVTELITTKDGITFQLSSNHIYVHLPDNELLRFNFRKSDGKPFFEIPWREDLNMLVKLIKMGKFQVPNDSIYVATILKTNTGNEINCCVPF